MVNRDPSVALVALVLILVVGSVAAIVGALRADRANTRAAKAAPPVAAEPIREGEWSLVLDSAGSNRVQVVKELRTLTGLGIAEAKRLTDKTPSIVLNKVDRSSVDSASRSLTAAGASVRVAEG